jgi:hypothetical protein
MSISDLYSSGLHKRNLGHFASIVKLVLSDGFVADGEKELLDRMAMRLEVSTPEYESILKDPNVYPINPPVDYDRRIERLFNLTKMIFADGEATKDQIKLLDKICVGLGFSFKRNKEITKEAVNQFMNENDLDAFSKAIKKLK